MGTGSVAVRRQVGGEWYGGSPGSGTSVDRLCPLPDELPRGWSFGNHKERRERKDVALRPAKLVAGLTHAG